MEEDSKKKQIIAIVIVLIVVILVFGGLALTSGKDNETVSTETTPSTVTSISTDTNSSSANTTGYKDGTYAATGSYTSPGGREKITINVTLKSGKVTETSATQGATDDEAEEYQAKFIAGYKGQVVGKDIDSLSLSRVSGSSLTSQGFNDAIEQVKNQAKA